MLHYQLARKAYFSAAHRYINADWSAQKNREVFGSCYSEHGHGHNYVVEALVSGPLDKTTGMILNLADLDRLLKEVVKPLDHSFLNSDVPYFHSLPPTTENIALFCFQELEKRLSEFPSVSLERVRLHENEDLWAEVRA